MKAIKKADFHLISKPELDERIVTRLIQYINHQIKKCYLHPGITCQGNTGYDSENKTFKIWFGIAADVCGYNTKNEIVLDLVKKEFEKSGWKVSFGYNTITLS